MGEKGCDEPKFDADFNRPLVEIVVLFDANFACAADMFHIIRKGCADFSDKSVKFWFPLILQYFDHSIELGFCSPQAGESIYQLVNLLSTFFEFSKDAAIAFVHEFQTGFFAFNLVVELLHCLSFW